MGEAIVADEIAPVLRADFERIRAARRETRPGERLAAHFAVEARLARQLAQSNPQQRSALYASVYRELFASVPDHPQHRRDRTGRQDHIRAQAAFLLSGLSKDAVFVELGCGDAGLTKTMATHVGMAIGVDVTGELITGEAPTNFRFLRTDGIALQIETATVDLVYSNQLMEHLHIDDAMEQLREIYRILKPGGRYICTTPNRLTGPHDISVYFGVEPKGLHMREYDHRSLTGIFRSVGFTRVAASVSAKGRTLQCPAGLAGLAESLVEALPRGIRGKLLQHRIAEALLGLTLIGTKSSTAA